MVPNNYSMFPPISDPSIVFIVFCVWNGWKSALQAKLFLPWPFFLAFISKPTLTSSESRRALRATSHKRLKARDHCNLRGLIDRKGRDRPSSLHTWRWRPKGPKKTSWMKSLHGVLHGRLWIRFCDLPEFSSSPPLRDGLDANSRRPWIF